MDFKRSCGILLHPTSLPGKYGIGDIGKEAFKFIDFLEKAGQKIWQILPLGPTGYGNSPYQCYSSLAGNPLLISLEELVEKKLLSKQDVDNQDLFNFTENQVNFEDVQLYKNLLLQKAYNNFTSSEFEADQNGFDLFCKNKCNWLDDYALFMALKKYFNDLPWYEWADDFKLRNAEALNFYKQKLKNEIALQQFIQYLFFSQWEAVRLYANTKGIKIIGDIPLYVSFDSADVWIYPEYFLLDEHRNPISVSGVPPDYFSKTGQLWGNPVYNWEVLEKNQFSWWVNRIQENLKLYDIIRVDHFRGLSAYWAIPFGDETAINGEWIDAPGKQLFDTLLCKLGDLPLIAEDLGAITPEVEQLRDTFDFPGMKILQFAFDSDEANEYLPHTYIKNCIAYTGTHDNNTVRGWWNSTTEENKQHVLDYLNCSENDVCWTLIRAVWSSVANIAIVPLQDLLELGEEGRMNTPGATANNWLWRFREDSLTNKLAEKMKKITTIYDR